MKIVIYDPLFSDMGHFYRYNKFICTLLSNIQEVNKITILAESEKLQELINVDTKKVNVIKINSSISNLQTYSIQSSIIGKIKLYVSAFNNYIMVIDKINQLKPDYVFFLSQGQLPFWIAIRKLKSKFIISSISIKWLYSNSLLDKLNYYFFREALKLASSVMFTETIYNNQAINCGINSGFIFPDRFLHSKKTADTKVKQINGKIQLVTLGTIARGKSPENFLIEFLTLNNDLRNKFHYTIAGKDIDGSMINLSKKLKINSEVSYTDEYLSGKQFCNLMENADFVVIPYNEDYTKYATSGIMWDCFEKSIPILCPDIELFNSYISKYKIGYTYKMGMLDKTLAKIVDQRQTFNQEITENFIRLENDFNEMVLTRKFKQLLDE